MEIRALKVYCQRRMPAATTWSPGCGVVAMTFKGSRTHCWRQMRDTGSTQLRGYTLRMSVSPIPSIETHVSASTRETNVSKESKHSTRSHDSKLRVEQLKSQMGEKPPPKDRVTLASKLEKDHIQTIHDIFKEKLKLDPNRPRLVGSEYEFTTLRKAEMKSLLCDKFGIGLDEDEFNVIFLKMDTNRSGSISWDEMLSHLLVELGESQEAGNQPQNSELLADPINGLPERIRSYHRHPIIRITFFPEVAAVLSQLDDTYTQALLAQCHKEGSLNEGRFITASRDGAVQSWSMDLKRGRLDMSKCVLLRVRPTWVTDLACLPDVSMICTSSTERELRFYDTIAGKWQLRVLISGVDKPVVCMHYHMSRVASGDSALIMGDTGGNIRVMLFSSELRGPFRQGVGREVTHVLYKDLAKEGGCKALPGLRLVHLMGVHSNWVRQVSFYESLQAIVSCATCPSPSMFLCDVGGNKTQYKYNVPSGLYCFCVSEETHMIATGGPDCVLRLWNPFVCEKASAQLIGHHAAIVSIVIQEGSSENIFSLDIARCVRVWDMHSHSCIQAYSSLMGGPRIPLSTYYHPLSRAWMIASRDISMIRLCPQLNPDRTDGHTHNAPVSCVLYNTLFKCVVTTGLGSSIMVWDPWRGTRTLLVKNAHSQVRYGRDEPVEITAACFDPPHQLLLTGAANGTLRIWNFNSGICVRNMTIGVNREVTAVMWVPSRILAAGWNMRVMEWADGSAAREGKSWDLRHSSHILCADSRPPDALATATDSGELVLWRLETGQSYARYRVDAPVHKSGMAYYVEKEVKPPKYWTPVHMPRNTGAQGLPPRVHAVKFLRSRPVSRGVASLMVSLSTGYVQVWSHHAVGGYLTTFLAVHTVADYVMCMETDPECNYLFTGHSAGYIKIWLMSNYCYPAGPVVTLFMPAMRKTFPFLFRDRIPGRAKRAVKDQTLPMLLSSFRGHLQPVTFLQYAHENKILFSASADRSVRLWSLGGEYIGTLGTMLTWPQLSPDLEWETDLDVAPRIPADLKRVSSSTTLKVLRRGAVEWLTPTVLERARNMQTLKPITADELFPGTYGIRLYKPLVGACFKLPSKAIGYTPTVTLQTDLPKIPVYHHIKLVGEQPIPRPLTPESVRAIRNLKLDSDDHDRPRQEPGVARRGSTASRASRASRQQQQ